MNNGPLTLPCRPPIDPPINTGDPQLDVVLNDMADDAELVDASVDLMISKVSNQGTGNDKTD